MAGLWMMLSRDLLKPVGLAFLLAFTFGIVSHLTAYKKETVVVLPAVRKNVRIWTPPISKADKQLNVFAYKQMIINVPLTGIILGTGKLH